MKTLFSACHPGENKYSQPELIAAVSRDGTVEIVQSAGHARMSVCIRSTEHARELGAALVLWADEMDEMKDYGVCGGEE